MAMAIRQVSLVVGNIPTTLRGHRQWITWRDEMRPGRTKPTKNPYNPRTGRFASSTDPQSWSSFEQALAVVAQYDGVGLRLRAGGRDRWDRPRRVPRS